MADKYSKEIDLGRDEGAMPMPASVPKGEKSKPRKFYPTLYIDAVPGLEMLPKEGCMMVKFRRRSLRLENEPDGKETAGATLEILKLCLPDDGEDGETLEDAFAKLGKGEVADDAAYGYEDAEDDE